MTPREARRLLAHTAQVVVDAWGLSFVRRHAVRVQVLYLLTQIDDDDAVTTAALARCLPDDDLRTLVRIAKRLTGEEAAGLWPRVSQMFLGLGTAIQSMPEPSAASGAPSEDGSPPTIPSTRSAH